MLKRRSRASPLRGQVAADRQVELRAFSFPAFTHARAWRDPFR